MSTSYQTALTRIRQAAEKGAATLDLSGLGLEILPPEIGALTRLTELNLARNRLTALPPEIGALTRLTKLNLSHNRLTALPPEIGALTRLTELNLWGNQLTALPPAIGALTRLTELNLARNRLTALPRAIPGVGVPHRPAARTVATAQPDAPDYFKQPAARTPARTLAEDRLAGTGAG